MNNKTEGPIRKKKGLLGGGRKRLHLIKLSIDDETVRREEERPTTEPKGEDLRSLVGGTVEPRRYCAVVSIQGNGRNHLQGGERSGSHKGEQLENTPGRKLGPRLGALIGGGENVQKKIANRSVKRRTHQSRSLLISRLPLGGDEKNLIYL